MLPVKVKKKLLNTLLSILNRNILLFFIVFVSLFGKGYAQNIVTNTIGVELANIPAGKFYMGANETRYGADESPVHIVTLSKAFKMSIAEITNKQYEQFDSSHKKLRGKGGFSVNDNEAVVQVSWYDAAAFCKWLSQKEGKIYRLPTEAEWEYACRANTYSNLNIGDKLPANMQKNQDNPAKIMPVSLKIKNGKPNEFGLYDMHGNVEEWCMDWYGPYKKEAVTDPVGYKEGSYRVVRGGSHNTFVSNIRSANRSALIPEDRNYLTGFRIVEVTSPLPEPILVDDFKPLNQQEVKQGAYNWPKPVKTPFFAEPIVYVKKPLCNNPQLYTHNHCPAITWCKNGDLLAIWFSTESESGTEMAIWASRLRAGNKDWDEASPFYKVPDRNMTGSSLFYDKDSGTLFHLNGMSAAGWWKNMIVTLRTSTDNGSTWSKETIIAPEHTMRHQVIAGMFKTKEGWLVQPCDAGPGGADGSAILVSKDNGKTWADPALNIDTPKFEAGNVGGTIAGIHTGVVQLKNGDFMAFGRANDIQNADGVKRMPMSISKDGGKTWTYSASEFPPISGGQRLVLRRLNEGAILLVSFTHHPLRVSKDKAGMEINGKKVYGIYAAVSFDEGKTWPVKKLISDGKHRYMDGGAWTGAFIMDETNAEPRGYFAATQTPDNIIHLISSKNHYRFNLEWLKEK